ncbi:MAG: DUF3147 family protein [Myxococcales bacterium]|nr:DUF3147 family protein [Myxococcales bacterium]MCB9531169.1 DUF3147 family protein [Myxococcales bacterium]
MVWLVVKWAVTATLVVALSEIASRYSRIGGVLAALPTVTVLTLVWMQLEGVDPARIRDHAWYTFWYVVPTLPMFLVFPAVHVRLGFWPALTVSAVVSVASFFAFARVVGRFGVNLL